MIGRFPVEGKDRDVPEIDFTHFGKRGKWSEERSLGVTYGISFKCR